MKNIIKIVLLVLSYMLIQNLAGDKIFCQFTVHSVPLERNNIRSFVGNTGVFDRDIIIHTDGFQWPIGSGKTAIFTAGLTIAAYVNNQLRMASASSGGEYRPGYCVNGNFQTNANFKLYSVKRGDNWINNNDWLNWGNMVLFGAPYIDVNHNGTYEYYADTPGVVSASQTVFVCLTDADSSIHTTNEGFGGGTLPLGAEVHTTFWCYDNPGYGDMQFMKWVVFNKSTILWDSTIVSIYSDPDLGDASDDYVGCDSTKNLGFCYNADDNDSWYGIHPPAIGFIFLNCNNTFSRLSSFTAFHNNGSLCERDALTPVEAYWYMKGFKKDGSPWLHVPSQQPTKFCYPGDPESNSGWTEYTGNYNGCGGTIGNLISPSMLDDRRFVMSFKPTNQRLNPGDSLVIQSCQLIARGINNLNSVTLLKQLADVAKNLCQNGFVIGITPISTEIPKQFLLEQNYPNPFNPNTVISFQLTVSSFVSLIVYDVLGREVTTLVNEKLKAGTFKVDWDGAGFANGVYFYSLVTDNFSQTKKMVLIK